MRHLSGIDHCILLVRDLDEAERRLARLGFRPTPRGCHAAAMGTANTTAVFRDGTYVEAMGVVAETAENAAVRAELARREGLYGLAFKTEDARAAAADLAALGLGPAEALDFSRPVELPASSGDGSREAAFSVARTRAGSTPGAWIFACQHHTPTLVWREDHLDQPNGVTGLAEVVGVADDLAGLAHAYEPLFEERVRGGGEEVMIATGTAVLSFLSPAALAARFGTAVGKVSGTPASLVALRFTVANLAATERVLAEAGVAVSRSPAGTLLVPSGEACGALLEFAPP